MQRRLFLGAASSLAGLPAADGPGDLGRVAVGTTAPDFDLPNAEGKALRLGSLRGQRVVVVFYRGQW